MKIINSKVRNAFKLIICLGFIAGCFADTKNSSPIYRLNTVAGELEIIQQDKGALGRKFLILLHKNVVLSTDGDKDGGRFSDFPMPKVLKDFNGGIPPFDEVILFQQYDWGNACNGGPLWFLGLSRNGSFKVSKEIDFCGGKQPITKIVDQQVFITIPLESPTQGERFTSEEWIYKNGIVTRKPGTGHD